MAENEGEGNGGNGTGVAEWLEGAIPEDMRNDPAILSLSNAHKTKADFGKALKGMVEVIGRKGVLVPKPGATQEELDTFFNAIGRPKTATEYKLSEVKDLHPSIKVNPESQAAFFQAAHKSGLTTAQADQMHAWYMGLLNQTVQKNEQSQKQTVEATATALRQKWGGQFDANLMLAKRVVERFGGKEAMTSFGDLGNNPVALQTLAAIGHALSEDTLKHLGFSSLAASKVEAQQKIDAIKGDTKHAYNDEKNPLHDKAVQEMRQLYILANAAE